MAKYSLSITTIKNSHAEQFMKERLKFYKDKSAPGRKRKVITVNGQNKINPVIVNRFLSEAFRTLQANRLEQENRPKKIDVALSDTKLRLGAKEQELMLLARDIIILKEQYNSLKIINENESFV